MSLYEKIQNDMKEAMKSRDMLRTNTLRSVIAAVKNFQASSKRTERAK